MNEKFNTNLESLVSAITENYEKEELFLVKEDLNLPSRNVIIDIIRDLKRLIFPGYFGTERLNHTLANYFVGEKLAILNNKLMTQVTCALSYKCQDGSCTDSLKNMAEDISINFFEKLPNIQRMLLMDVQAAFDGDPAASSKEQVIFSYPGLFAIFIYRIAHELYLMDVPFIPRIMTEYAHSRTGIDINAGAQIGKYFFIDHGTGVVIGETTIIGDYVKIYQGVTLGALSTRGGQKLADVKRHPTIEDNVTIYSGASILGGDTIIGEGAIIGGNAFITKSVSKNTRVSVKNPELKFKNEIKKPIDPSSSEYVYDWII